MDGVTAGTPRVHVAVKSVVSFLVFVFVYIFTFWMLFAQILPEDMPWLSNLAALVTGAVAGVLIWRGMDKQSGIAAIALRWAAIVGAVCFCGGFFGPMFLMPAANQGPLFGLFMTGPLGFIGGGIGGLIYALWRNRA